MATFRHGWLAHWWGRAIAGGVIASVAMALYMMGVMAAQGLGGWTFLNVVAAMIPTFRPPTAGFDPLAVPVGALLHLLGGIILALPYAVITWAIAPAIDEDLKPELITGLLYGALMYVVVGRLIGPMVDPAIAFLPMGHYLIGYLIFGTVNALVVAAIAQRTVEPPPPVTFAPREEDARIPPRARWR